MSCGLGLDGLLSSKSTRVLRAPSLSFASPECHVALSFGLYSYAHLDPLLLDTPLQFDDLHLPQSDARTSNPDLCFGSESSLGTLPPLPSIHILILNVNTQIRSHDPLTATLLAAHTGVRTLDGLISAHSARLRPLEEYEHGSASARAHVPPQKRVPLAVESAVNASRSLCPTCMPLLGLTSLASISRHLPLLTSVPIESRRRISMDNNRRTTVVDPQEPLVPRYLNAHDSRVFATHVPKAHRPVLLPIRGCVSLVSFVWFCSCGQRGMGGSLGRARRGCRTNDESGAGDDVSWGVVLRDVPPLPPNLQVLECWCRYTVCRREREPAAALRNVHFRDS
ncbi:hypothetical protein MSAN_02416400 [Mycena sanguinolenta]|uniref:Uncharacterized protein n=1 Tax=Mycena sanguinolenta TaxID=230812 RepID=A0A8H6X3X4_9AGAR|nr:hypothetical protein MSAN_02416400 [Mycena sanguinolenta]